MVHDQATVPAGAKRIRLVLAIGRQLLSELLAARLDAEPDLDVLAVVEEPARTGPVLRRLRPDVLLLGSRFLPGDMADVAAHIRTASPSTRLVLVSGPLGRAVVLEAVEAGLSSFARSDESVEDLLEAVRAAASGRPHVNEELVDRLVTQMERSRRAARDQLTAREREVLRLLAEGRTPTQIAEDLGRSVNTIRHHVQRILDKLGVHSQLAAVTQAVQLGLVRQQQ